VSGSGLTGNLVVTAPAGYEVSLSSGSGYGSSVSLTPVAGSVGVTNIYARLTASASGTPSGNITVTSTGATAKNVSVSGTVVTVSGSTAVTNVLCNGNATGAITLTPSGGAAPYTYNWGGGVTTKDRTGLTAGSYSVIITDNNGCVGFAGATVTQPNPVTGSTVVTNVSCNGAATGAITLIPNGGTGTYTYDWGGGVTTQNRTGLTAGNYSVTITDQNGCTGVANTTITQPAAPVSGTTMVTNIVCNGTSTGAIDLTPTGGVGGYTYNWGGGITTQDRTNIPAGNYTVTITDANLCTGVVNATVTQLSAVTGSTMITNTSCNGGSNGAIDLTPSGGTAPYTFDWGGAITTEDRTGLTAGSYSVNITDNNGCVGTVNATVNQPSAVTGSTSVTNVSCNGGSNGAINLTPNGGTAPYTYNWGGGVTTEDRSGLAPGTYNVTITDNNGCTGGTSATVNEPAAVSGTASTTNVSCFGGSNGTITITPAGGNGTYTYDWGGGVTSQNRTGLSMGTYSVTITDGNGCTGSVNGINIAQPAAAVSGSAMATNVLCNGAATGAIDLTPAGGTPPYTFNWGGGVTTEDRNNIPAGSYIVLITDLNGCIGVANATITQPSAPVSGSTVVTNVACNSASTGEIDLTPSGGVGGYTFDWGGGVMTEDRTGLTAGNYSVTIRDVNLCTGVVNVTVGQPTALSGSTSITHVSCNGGNNGAINLTVTGGTLPYNYNWGGGIFTEDRISLSAGNYSVSITDGNGCNQVVNATVNEPTVLDGSAAITNVSCNGGSNGVINITPSGGTAPYTYNWGGGVTTQNRTGLTAGNYSVIITDNNGCTKVVNATVTEPAAIVVYNVTGGGAYCSGGAGQAIGLSNTEMGVNYQLYNGAATVGAPIAGTGAAISFGNQTAAGTYTVVATNTTTLCTANMNGNAVVSINPTPDVNTITSQTVCNGVNTTLVTFSGSVGGTTYNWTNNATSIGLAASGTGNIAAFAGTNTGNTPVIATITVTPSTVNCTGTAKTFTYTVNPTPTVNNITNQTVCNGVNTTLVTPTGSGVAGTTYNWTNNTTSIGLAASGTGNIPVFAGTNTGSTPVVATVTVTPVANSCPGTAKTYTYTVNPTPSVNTIANQTVCNGASTTLVTPTGSAVAGTTYNWTNDNTSIGLAASGTGSIAAFTATNTGNTPVTATITVTPTANSCPGISRTFTITVNPTPTVNNITNQTVCNGITTTVVTPTGSAVAGTTYNWSNNTTSIGLAASGSGNIPAFAAVNTGSAPVVATVTVIPTANSCNGTAKTYTYTVNPTPSVSTITNQTVCNGASTALVTFTGSAVAGTTYNWTNDNTSIGLAASGTGNIAAFAATNAGNTPVTATVTVTPVANSCPGTSRTFTITVNPTPTVDNFTNQTVCNGITTTLVTPTGSAVAGTTYNWTNNTTSIGLAASGTGNIPAFAAVNTGSAPVVATVTVTPTANSCNGTAKTYTYTVNPTPSVNAISNQAVCNGASTAAITMTGSAVAGTTYSWTNTNTSIGLAASGSGNIAAFTATNAGTTPEVATVTVTPSANGCPGTARTFTITVNPTPTVNNFTDQTLCSGLSTTLVTPTGSPVAGTTYNWTNTTPSIGLAASGTGNIPVFTATSGNTQVVATVTVTPVANSCPGTAKSYTYTINPTPDVNTITSQTICNGNNTTAVTFSGAVAGTTYNWTNNTTSIGLAASGTGNISAFSATNAGNAPVVATVTVTPSTVSCPGTAKTFTYTVNPTPSVNNITDQTVCNGVNTTAVTFAGSTVAGTTYNWTNNTTSIGLAASGTGNIAAFAGTNTGSAPVVATVTVTPVANGCNGTAKTYTYTVNPTPSVNTIANQAVCNGASTTLVTPTGSAVAGTTYNWTNNTTSIGLAASGTGNIPAFTATNTGTAPVVATITVTPTANGCPGTARTFTITVNPTPTVNTVSNQTVCNGLNTTAVTFSGAVAGTTYNWTNNTTSIGLAASGSGNIAAFAAANTGSTAVTATVTVTPVANSCPGSSTNYTYTVNPTPSANTITNQTWCNGATTTAVTPAGSAVAGTVYNWTNNTTSIGLAASGSGTIPSFTAVNTGTAPVVATVTVTPTANSCNGTARTYTYTVNPTPTVNTITNQTVCNATSTTAVTFTGAVTGTTYNWTNNTTSIGLAASGTGNIAAFTATNTGSTAVTATVTVTPTANSCAGTARTYTYTVNPTPSVNTITNQTLCNGSATVAVTPTGSTVTGTTYNWTNNTTSIGLAASGTGTIPVFTATNTGTAPVTATITVTPTANGCNGTARTYTYTVNPTPTVNAIANQVRCAGTTTAAVTMAGPVTGTTYAWTNNTTSIGLAASGTGNIASFTAANTTNAPVVATVTVTPTANTCVGTPLSYTYTVNPAPTVDVIANQAICNGAPTTAVTITGTVAGTTFAWANNNTSIGLPASGSGNIASFNAVNTGTAPVTATITITPSANSCTGTTRNFTITVNPTPTVNAITNQTRCAGANTAAVNFTGAVTGTVYNWTNSNTGIGLAASGTGNIAAFAATNTTNAPITGTVTVTPTANSCTGSSRTFTYTVNPTATVDLIADQAICNGFMSSPVTISGPVAGTTFAWTNNNTSIGLAASGTGTNIPAFTAVNPTTDPLVATVSITPTANTCVGTVRTFKYTVNPTPAVNFILSTEACANSLTKDIIFGGPVLGTTYSWTNTNATIGLPASGNGNIAPFTALNTGTTTQVGNITVTPTANTCVGPSKMFSIAVHPIPTLSSATTTSPICGSEQFNYTPTADMSTASFAWRRSSDPNINNGREGAGVGPIKEVLHNTGTTAVTVTYNVDAKIGNCASTTPIQVTVNPLPLRPEISTAAPDAVCSNTLYQNFGANTPPAGTTYSWSTDNAMIYAKGETNEYCLVNFSWPGWAAVKLTSTIASTGCSNTSIYNVNVGTSESHDMSVTFATGKFQSSLRGADNYTWGYDDKVTLDSTVIEGENMADYMDPNPDLANKYYWVIAQKDGCMQKAYYNKPTGVNTVTASRSSVVKLYPNPATDVVVVETNAANTQASSITLFDMAGKNLKTVPVKGSKTEVSVSELTPGVYFMGYYQDGSRVATLKFIKN
jgi:hypothetical protein